MKFKILALTSAYKPLVDIFGTKTVKSISDYSFLFRDKKNEILKYGNEIAVINKHTLKIISKKDLIYYLGLSMMELVNIHGEKKAYDLFKTKGRKVFLPVNIMITILKFEKPILVFSTISPRFERASLIAANMLNIKSMQIHDLYIDHKHNVLEAEHVIVMNRKEKQTLLHRYKNYSSDNVYPLGQPIINKTVEEVSKIKVRKRKKVLCFITPGSIKITNKKYLSNLFLLFKEFYNKYHCNIIIRVHPNVDKKIYLRYAKTIQYITICDNKDSTLYQVLAISNIIVTYQSTVALEAIALNKIVLTFTPTITTKYDIKQFKMKPFIFSKNFYQLKQVLIRIATLKYYNKPKNKISYLSNNANEQIINLIKKLVK